MSAHAHKASDSYLTLKTTKGKITGQWDIALRDLEFSIGIDKNGDGEISWGELKSNHKKINQYVTSKLQISTNNIECKKEINRNLLDNHTDGAYTILQFSVDCPQTTNNIKINYSLFFDFDTQHRGLIKLITDQGEQSFVFSPKNRTKTISLQNPDHWQQLTDYTQEGVIHILAGFDHILFLLALLLPAVLYLKNNTWVASTSLKTSSIEVIKIVTAFTIAHSITLALASLNIIYLPSRLVESVIAVSVIVAATNNIYPFINKQRWKLAFFFGLIHGFGFSSVLQDLNLSPSNLAYSLVGFNLGVELGQLFIISIFLPTAYLIRKHWYYKKIILQFGSIATISLSCIWLLERSFDIKLLS